MAAKRKPAAEKQLTGFHLRRDVHIGVIVTLALQFLSLVGGGGFLLSEFSYVKREVSELRAKTEGFNKIAVLESNISNLAQALSRVERQLDRFNDRLSGVRPEVRPNQLSRDLPTRPLESHI